MEAYITLIVIALVGILTTSVLRLIEKKIGREKVNEILDQVYAKKELALLAVKFIEQAYGGKLFGEEKYNKAAQWLADRLNSLGFKFTSEEIKGLIEAALVEMKKEYGEWKGNGSNETGIEFDINMPSGVSQERVEQVAREYVKSLEERGFELL